MSISQGGFLLPLMRTAEMLAQTYRLVMKSHLKLGDLRVSVVQFKGLDTYPSLTIFSGFGLYLFLVYMACVCDAFIRRKMGETSKTPKASANYLHFLASSSSGVAWCGVVCCAVGSRWCMVAMMRLLYLVPVYLP